MPRVINFDFTYDNDFQIIGISSHLRAYKLIFFLNTVLKYNFKRTDDILIKSDNKELTYSLYVYFDKDTRTEFFLVANHHPEMKLIPRLKQIDYFLMLKSVQDNNKVSELTQKIKNIPRILTAYKIEQKNIKNIDLILNDIEMHILKNN